MGTDTHAGTVPCGFKSRDWADAKESQRETANQQALEAQIGTGRPSQPSEGARPSLTLIADAASQHRDNTSLLFEPLGP